MKTVTYKEFLAFDPSWFGREGEAERLKAHFERFGGNMSALDILNLDAISAEDKLWAVLREEFIPAPILHEFACVCAEYALSLLGNPDPRSVKAIETKRAWLRGEATGRELDAASDDAWKAAWEAIWEDRESARAAAWAARATARAAARAAACYASEADWEAARGDSRDAASDAAREAQIAYLIMTLEEEK